MFRIKENINKIKTNPIFGLIKHRDFRTILIGEFVSTLGDQFYLVALPWLILQITGSAFAMGTIYAVGTIPSAFFVVVGGILTDKFSSRKVMILSNVARMILVGMLGFMVLKGAVTLPILYIFSFFFGIADAFFFPAQRTIVFKIVPKNKLTAGNAIIQGITQLSAFLGPGLAGFTIAWLSGFKPGRLFLEKKFLLTAHSSDFVASSRSVGLSLLIDAATFAFSVMTLFVVKALNDKGESINVVGITSFWRSFKEVFVQIWKDHLLRGFGMIICVLYLFTIGPLTTGLPFLANLKLSGGVADLGILLSSLGGGVLMGVLIAGVFNPKRKRKVITFLVACGFCMGISLILLPLLEVTWIISLICVMMGVCIGYTTIMMITFLQKRVPEEMVGRIMGIAMFSYTGLLPFSHFISGGLIQLNYTWFFIFCGIITIFITVYSSMQRELRSELEKFLNTF
jgi:MFS family permease